MTLFSLSGCGIRDEGRLNEGCGIARVSGRREVGYFHVEKKNTGDCKTEEIRIQFNDWNPRNTHYILGHVSVHGWQIGSRGVYSWWLNVLQTNQDLPVREFLFVSPTERHERLINGKASRFSTTSSSQFIYEKEWEVSEQAFRIEITQPWNWEKIPPLGLPRKS